MSMYMQRMSERMLYVRV